MILILSIILFFIGLFIYMCTIDKLDRTQWRDINNAFHITFIKNQVIIYNDKKKELSLIQRRKANITLDSTANQLTIKCPPLFPTITAKRFIQ